MHCNIGFANVCSVSDLLHTIDMHHQLVLDMS
jgi:hypothetical protein